MYPVCVLIIRTSPSTVLYCTVLYCTVLYCTVQYCTVLYCTVLYCTVLYCTVLYCTVSRCEVVVTPGPGLNSLPTRHRTQEMRKWSELQFIWTQTNWDPQIISYSALPGPGRVLLILLHCTCCLRKQCFIGIFYSFQDENRKGRAGGMGTKISVFKT